MIRESEVQSEGFGEKRVEIEIGRDRYRESGGLWRSEEEGYRRALGRAVVGEFSRRRDLGLVVSTGS